MTRKIVYLDHSVLSDLAKGKCRLPLEDFMSAVSSDRAIFPFSWTHHIEAQLDDRLETKIYAIGAKVSRGVRFLWVADIVARQALRAYLSFLGEESRQPLWADAFEHDPQSSVAEELAHTMTHARVSSSSSARSEIRLYRQTATADPLIAADRMLSFDNAKSLFRSETIESCFLKPRTLEMNDFRTLVREEAFRRFGPIAGDESMFEFFESPLFTNLPFLDIEASIRASLYADERGRKPGRGDFHDIQTWATYTPYVDIAVVEQNMHALVSRRIARRHDCLFLPHNADGLKALLAELQPKV